MESRSGRATGFGNPGLYILNRDLVDGATRERDPELRALKTILDLRIKTVNQIQITDCGT